jgi:hypothetical protein
VRRVPRLPLHPPGPRRGMRLQALAVVHPWLWPASGGTCRTSAPTKCRPLPSFSAPTTTAVLLCRRSHWCRRCARIPAVAPCQLVITRIHCKLVP